MIITKTSTGFTFILSGGAYGLLAFVKGINDMAPLPTNITTMQWINYFSPALGAFASLSAVIAGVIFFILRHRETKRHNKAMEPKDDS